MKRTHRLPRTLRWIAVGIALILLIGLLPGQAFAQTDPPSPLLPSSNIAEDTAGLFWIVITIGGVVFVLVNVLIIYAIIRYRRRDEDEMPAQVHGNTRLEILWTVIPALIMVVLFGLTLDMLLEQEQAPPDAMVVEVIGRQWFWEFRYPDTEVSLRNELVLPVGVPIQFQITSADVIHSFWIPELAGKMDAIPGHTNTLWFEITNEGHYAGQCAEFCGLEHYAMLFDVTALSQEDYDAWMEEQVFLASQFQAVYPDATQPLDLAGLILPTGDAARGETLFAETYACTACHSLDGSQLVGPSVQGLGQRAGTRISGYTPEQYLIESILRPCDYVVSGFTCVMPQNYGQQMEAQDLADLIAYLLQQ
ncbi:MAG: cytochrome c oxidase subunit II [Anaerolineae bacterium]